MIDRIEDAERVAAICARALLDSERCETDECRDQASRAIATVYRWTEVNLTQEEHAAWWRRMGTIFAALT